MSNARSRLAAYGRTPKELLRDPKISPGAKIVYTMVDEVAGHEDITIKSMAEWLGKDPKTARGYLHEIRDAGWVEVTEVITGQSGQRPSEYVANAYPFQHLSEPEDISSAPQAADQAERSTPVPVSSGPVEETGTPPSQKVPSTPVEQTGVPKTGTPRASQKVAPPSLRDDETKKPPTPARSLTSDQGFGEFWGKYPATEWKAKTNKSTLRGHWFSLTDQQRTNALTALDAYLASALWVEITAVPGPKLWLENEPWLEVEYGSLPEPKPDTRIKWARPGEHRLED